MREVLDVLWVACDRTSSPELLEELDSDSETISTSTCSVRALRTLGALLGALLTLLGAREGALTDGWYVRGGDTGRTLRTIEGARDAGRRSWMIVVRDTRRTDLWGDGVRCRRARRTGTITSSSSRTLQKHMSYIW